MPLAHAEGGVPVVPEDFGNSCCVVADVAELAGKAGTEVRHGTHPDGVLRTTGQQRRASRRAQWRDVEVGELCATRSERVDVRCIDIGAVATELREAGVVKQNDHDVRCAIAGVRRLIKPCLGISEGLADLSFKT